MKSLNEIITSFPFSKNFCINFFKENNLSILNIFSDSNYEIFFVYCKNKNKEYFLYKCDTQVQNLLNIKLNSNNIIKNIIYNTNYILIISKNNPLLFNNICEEIKLDNNILDILKLAKKIYLTFRDYIIILYNNIILKYKIMANPYSISKKRSYNFSDDNIIDILYNDFFDTRYNTLFLLTNKYDILSLGFLNPKYIDATNIYKNINKNNLIAQFYKYNRNLDVYMETKFIRSNFITLFSYKKKNIQINQTHQLTSDIIYTNTIDNKKKFIGKYYTIFLHNNNTTIDLHYFKNNIEIEIHINNFDDDIKIKNIFCIKSFFLVLTEHNLLYYIPIKYSEDIFKKIKLKHYDGIILNVDTVYSHINSNNHIIKYKNNDYIYYFKNLLKQTNENQFCKINYNFLSFLYKSNSYQIKYIHFFENIVIILFVNNFIIILFNNMEFIKLIQLEDFKESKKNINYCSDCGVRSVGYNSAYEITFNCYGESVKYLVAYIVNKENNRIYYDISNEKKISK